MPSTHKLPSITEVSDVAGKYVLVRCPFNIPVADGQVQNQFRIFRSLATIEYLVERKARVILISHIANNKKTESQETLRPVYEALQEHIPGIIFSPEVATSHSQELRDGLKDGEVLLLENLRQDPREKKNDADFARALADLADLYVNNDFTVSHREHAGIVAITQFLPSYVGINFMNEYAELSQAMEPSEPSIFMLGGAKFDTKLPLVHKFLDLYDHVFIGGALVNDLFKAKGYEVGTSLLSEGIDASVFTELIAHPKLIMPVDVVVQGPDSIRTTTPEDVHPDEAILDAGPDTVVLLQEHIARARTILWNGPFGNYEKGFGAATEATARLVAESPAYSVVGGGDTITAIEAINLSDQFSFLSTAGGAMLTFLETNTLVGIEAFKQQQ